MKYLRLFLIVIIELNISNAQNVYFGDLHIHSNYSSDAIGNIDTIYNKARHNAKFDFICITDHDFSLTDSSWEVQKQITDKYYEPGRFVTLIGYEWTAHPVTRFGHRIILYRDNSGPLFRIERNENTIEDLFTKLRKQEAIINIAHPDHGPYESDTSYKSYLQKNIEIFGSNKARFEYFGNSNAPPKQVNGHSVQNWLANGSIFGFLGVSDDHSGRPGIGGITAVIADTLTRESLFDAINRRHVYATTGPKIKMSFSCNNKIMGDILYKNKDTTYHFEIMISGTAELSLVEILRNNTVLMDWIPRNTNQLTAGITVQDNDRSFYYLRITQKDGNMAWSSPIYLNIQRSELVTSVAELNNSFVLLNHYPNPFNSEVNIPYYVPDNLKNRDFILRIFNVTGQIIYHTSNKNLNSGLQQFHWNGQTGSGEGAPSGIYYFIVSAGEYRKSGKMVLLK
jgi:hypothetical protein